MLRPPDLDADETLAGRREATRGNAALAFRKGGSKKDALIVAVRCQGRGTMKVTVQSVHVSFPLKCLADKMSTTYNQIGVGHVDRSGVVSVEASSAVRWAITIGRGAPAEEEKPQATTKSL